LINPQGRGKQWKKTEKSTIKLLPGGGGTNAYYLVSSNCNKRPVQKTNFFAAALVKSQKSHNGNLANLVIQNMCIVYSWSTTQRYIILTIRETVITVSGSTILNLKISNSNLGKPYARRYEL